MEALSHCRYRHVATCNILYGGDMGGELARVMPEKYMHILTANNEGHGCLAQQYRMSQVMNMTNFMPAQSSLPAGTVHLNFSMEVDEDQLHKGDTQSVLESCHNFIVKSLMLPPSMLNMTNKNVLAHSVTFMPNGFPQFAPGGQLNVLKYLVERRDPRFAICGNYISRSAVSFAIRLAKAQVLRLV